MTTTAAVPPHHTTTALLPAWWPIARNADQLTPLAPRQCRELLPDAGHGWLSYPLEPGASQVAATYRVQGGSLLVTPGPTPALTAAPLVLFRIDHLDADRRAGWTVVVAGPLRAGGPDHAVATAGSGVPLLLDLLNLAGRHVDDMPTRDQLTTVA